MLADLRKDTSIEEGAGDFSLVLGGPLYRLWKLIRILKPPLGFLRLRIGVVAALAWLPLLVLAFVSGNALKGVPAPFLFDVDTHVRFLVVLPLLIVGELFVHRRLRGLVLQFVNRGIVPPEEQGKFQKIIDSSLRMRDSAFAELAMVALIWTLGHWFWKGQASLTIATWFAWREGDVFHYTPAGYWYAFASIPIFQFLLIRWYYRIAIWWRFLWKVSRLNLKLIPTHPDRAGGIGFLGVSAYAFGPVLAAHTIHFAGVIANRIWHMGASLKDFKLEIGVVLFVLLAMVFVPLTAFSWKLMWTKRIGLGEYGNLSQKYVRHFDAKWIRGEAPAEETLVGNPDIQSLADLANSYNIIVDMKPVPFRKEMVFRMTFLLMLPFFPLVLTIIPIDQILDKMVGIIL